MEVGTCQSLTPLSTRSDVSSIRVAGGSSGSVASPDDGGSDGGRSVDLELEYIHRVGDWLVLGELGSGGNGTVYLCRHCKTREIAAIKFAEHVDVEIAAHRAIADHPHIIKLIGVVRRLTGGGDKYVRHDIYSWLVLEFAPLGSLRGFIKGKQPPGLLFTKSVMRQLLRGVAHCHAQGWMHRDIKPHNLLLSGDAPHWILKLADFGAASRFAAAGEPLSCVVGTLGYRAPELLLGAPTHTAAVDMWSVGCVFAELATGEPLLRCGSGEGHRTKDQLTLIFSALGHPGVASPLRQLQRYKDVCSVLRYWPGWGLARLVPGLPPAGLDLLQQLLAVDPTDRITAEVALVHPFLAEEAPAEGGAPPVLPTHLPAVRGPGAPAPGAASERSVMW